jgi:hypothetical protein
METMPSKLLILTTAAAAAVAIVVATRGAPPAPVPPVSSSAPARPAPAALSVPVPVPAAAPVPAPAPSVPDALTTLPPEDAEWVLDAVARAEQARELSVEERRELTAQLVSVRMHAVLERTEPLAVAPEESP